MHCKLPRSITFDPIVGFSRSILFRKQEVKIFSGKSRSIQSEANWGWWSLKGRRLERRAGAIISLRHPLDRREHIFFFLSFALCPVSPHVFFFLSSKHPKTHKKHPTNTSKLLILLSSPKAQGIVFIPNLPFLWFYTLDLGFRGVDVAFLAIIHIPNFLNLFLAFILLFLLE